MKLVRKCIIGVSICLVLLFLCFFFTPRSIQTSTWACDVDGNAVQVEIDIKLYRRLFSASYVEGSIFLAGEEYVDTNTLLESFSRIQDETKPSAIGSVPDNMSFCKKTALNEPDSNQKFAAAMSNRVFFLNVSGDDLFEKFYFIYMDESLPEGVNYYGPAKTAEEAKEIAYYLK